jgi:hypothetical protein
VFHADGPEEGLTSDPAMYTNICTLLRSRMYDLMRGNPEFQRAASAVLGY